MSDDGPHIQLATFCKDVSRDQEGGNLTITKCVTQATLVTVGPEAPAAMPPLPLGGLMLIVSIWAGLTKGTHRVQIVPEAPNKQKLAPLYQNDVHFEGVGDDLEGLDIILRPVIVIAQEGLYWFNVLLTDDTSERTLTRIPLNIKHEHRQG